MKQAIYELSKIAKGFTEGLLPTGKNKDLCFVVSYPLDAYLRFLGYDSELIEGEVRNGKNNHHYWIEVGDVMIDCTASQFNKPNGARMPKVYVGKKLDWYHRIYELSCGDCENELAEGTITELKNWVKNAYMDWDNVEYECDNIYLTTCTDCSRMLS